MQKSISEALEIIKKKVEEIKSNDSLSVASEVNTFTNNLMFLKLAQEHGDVPEYEEAKELINSLRDKSETSVDAIFATVNGEKIEFETREQFEARRKEENK